MSSEPITIRQAAPEDIPFLQAMAWEAAFASPTMLAHYDLETIRRLFTEYWERWTERPDPAFVAIDATGQKIGAAMLRPNKTDESVQNWLLFAIGMEANARSRGIGQQLIERVITFAKTTEAEYVNLFVDPMNSQARAFYQHLGFAETGEKDHAIEMRIPVK